jgi:hypothetical protein
MVKRRDRSPGAGPDAIDADLAASPEEIEAELRGGATLAGDGRDGPISVLTDELDLHNFVPRDCADLVAEYLRAAQDAGMTTVRVIHGKGTGTLRRIVHGVLDRHPAVRAYQLAGERSGSWGATIVELHPPVEMADLTNFETKT